MKRIYAFFRKHIQYAIVIFGVGWLDIIPWLVLAILIGVFII